MCSLKVILWWGGGEEINHFVAICIKFVDPVYPLIGSDITVLLDVVHEPLI